MDTTRSTGGHNSDEERLPPPPPPEMRSPPSPATTVGYGVHSTSPPDDTHETFRFTRSGDVQCDDCAANPNPGRPGCVIRFGNEIPAKKLELHMRAFHPKLAASTWVFWCDPCDVRAGKNAEGFATHASKPAHHDNVQASTSGSTSSQSKQGKLSLPQISIVF